MHGIKKTIFTLRDNISIVINVNAFLYLAIARLQLSTLTLSPVETCFHKAHMNL